MAGTFSLTLTYISLFLNPWFSLNCQLIVNTLHPTNSNSFETCYRFDWQKTTESVFTQALGYSPVSHYVLYMTDTHDNFTTPCSTYNCTVDNNVHVCQLMLPTLFLLIKSRHKITNKRLSRWPITKHIPGLHMEEWQIKRRKLLLAIINVYIQGTRHYVQVPIRIFMFIIITSGNQNISFWWDVIMFCSDVHYSKDRLKLTVAYCD